MPAMVSTGKPALARWLGEHRKATKPVAGSDEVMSVEDVARLVGRTAATVRGWEAGRPPKADSRPIRLLEEFYDSKAPTEGDDPGDLAAAIRVQAKAIEKMTESINVAALAVLTQQAGLTGGQAALGDLLARLGRGETLGELARSLQRKPRQ